MLPIAGAVSAGAPDLGVAAHYGDPMREQRMLSAGRAFVDLSNLGIIAVTGSARLSWLDTLSSQRVNALIPGESAEFLLLDPNGRVLHSAGLFDDGATAYLITEGDHRDPLAAFLESMRFMLDVAVSVREDLVTLGAVRRDPAFAALSQLAIDSGHLVGVWNDPWPAVTTGGTRYAFIDQHPGELTPFTSFVLEADGLDEFVAAARAAGFVPAGSWAMEALRVAAWRPRLDREVDDKSLPHELDWLRTAVHLNKGCYRGQEGVARTFMMGRPPRRLVMLHLDGSEHVTPEVGAAVVLEGRTVGRITSVARHFELGPVALAVLKRSVPPDVDLQVESREIGVLAASQETIVAPDGHGEGRPEPRGPLASGLRRRTL